MNHPGPAAKEWSIIAYARLSDEDRGKTDDEKSRSIENQIKYLEQYIENMKAKGEHVAGHTIITDDGKTGTDTNRSGFMEVLRLLKNKAYNCLLISDLSRGFRNISDQTYYLEEYFPLHEIRFISTSLQYVDNYLLPQSAMNLGVKFQGITNEQFAYDTSIKIRSKLHSKRQSGEFIGAFAPFGYDKHPDNNDRLIIDEAAAAVVRDIFKWYAGDLMSIGAITRKLNSLGLPNPTKYKRQRGLNFKTPKNTDGLWGTSSVRHILTNGVYLGNMIQGRAEIINYKVHKARRVPKENWYIVPGTHEPILDEGTFQKAQQLLARNVRAGTHGYVYPLGGILKCGDCEKSMARKTSRNTTYYCCRTYREKGKQFCGPHSIREDQLFQAVLEAINRQLAQLSDVPAILRRVSEMPSMPEESTFLENRIRLSQQELEKETAALDRIYYDFAKGNLSEQQYGRLRQTCAKREAQLQAEVLALTQEMGNLVKATKTWPAAFESFQRERRMTELTRALAVDFIESIYVYSDKSIGIKFWFADPTPRR